MLKCNLSRGIAEDGLSSNWLFYLNNEAWYYIGSPFISDLMNPALVIRINNDGHVNGVSVGGDGCGVPILELCYELNYWPRLE